jgi:tetratricopeptide (TPR) repeat protein/tRNA A-37 threonylcarbamoyl transferase component Bud32
MKIATGQHTWAEIEPFFDQLLDMVPEARATWLADLEQRQPTMATALRELLAEHDKAEASGFLAQPIDVATDRPLIGQQLGAYTIDSLLGRGGMGEVWLASRSDGRFEGKFAIKFLDSFATSVIALDRFRREGRLLARLTHANIARLIDAGVTTEGRPYLVLEYIAGEPIDRYCESQSLSVEARVRLMLQVLAAVAHAHSNLVVHRDIKPSNVLISADGSVKLLDFGVAKLLSTEASETAAHLTRIEDSAFTPEYAAPEQILGEPVSTSTDVYQLGVLLFVLLAGRLPLLTAGAKRTERIKAALETEAPRLSDVAPPPVQKQLRGDLDAIVAKAMRKKPEERYATAAALAADLRRYLDHDPVTARSGASAYRLRKFVRRYRGAVIGTSAAMLALIGTTTFAWLQMRQARAQRDELALQARRSDMQAEFVTLMMSSEQAGSTPEQMEKLLDKGLDLLEHHYPNDPAFRANMLINMSGRYMDLDDTDKEYAALVKAGAIARELNNDALIAEVECDMVETEISRGHVDLAAQRLAAGTQALARVANPPPLTIAYCMEAQSVYADTQGRTTEAIKLDEQQAAFLERADETSDVQFQSVLSHLALLYSHSGNPKKALEVYERQVAVMQRSGQVDTGSYDVADQNIAQVLMDFGEVRSSCEHQGELLSQRKNAGNEDVKSGTAVNWGTCLLKLGKPDDALIWYDKGLAVAHEEQNLKVQLYAHGNRARALIALRRYPDVERELNAVAELARNDPGASLRPATRAQITRAELLLIQGYPAQARSQLDPLLTAVRDPKGGLGIYLGAALLLSSRIDLAQRHAQDAETAAKEALSTFEKRARQPEQSADVGEALLLLAQAQAAANNPAGAHESAARAVVSLTNSLGADVPLTREAQALAR